MTRQAEIDYTDKLAAKIFAYVDREAGRDAPLSLEDELMVRDLLQKDQAAQAMADDFRAMNTDLDTLFDVNDIDVPDKLVSLILTHGAPDTESVENQEAPGRIIPFAPKPVAERKTWAYRPLAAAASLAFVIASGGLLYQYEVHHQEKLQFQLKLNQASRILTDSNSQLLQTRAEQRGLRKRLVSLVDEKQRLEQQIGERSEQVAALADTEAGGDTQTVRSSGEPSSEIDQDQFERRMAELSDALYSREQKLADTKTALSAAKKQAAAMARERAETTQQGQTHLADLETQLDTAREEVASLTTERDNFAGKVSQSRERIIVLEGNFNATLGKIVGLNTENDQLAAEKERYQKEASWLNQVAGYHRGYAGTMLEVEISAKEQENKQMLTKWLASMMGRDFTVPDLSASNLTFVGGRVFFVNGKPTGQIAYHDEEGRLTGFCFTASQDKPDSAPSRGQDDDLNLISWSKNGIDYVLVGWTAAPELEWIAKGLQRTYGGEV